MSVPNLCPACRKTQAEHQSDPVRTGDGRNLVRYTCPPTTPGGKSYTAVERQPGIPISGGKVA